MKSLKDYSLDLSEKDYHSYPAWSHSMVARYAREGFQAIATIHDPIKETDSMRFGTLFDTMLTRPEAFEKEYVLSNSFPPSSEKAVLDTLHEKFPELTDFDAVPDENIQHAIMLTGYQGRWKYQTQYEHLAEYKDYFNAIASGRSFVSAEDYNDAVDMKHAFADSEYISSIFGQTSDPSQMEYLYQTKFIANMSVGDKKLRVKIMPDLLVVNHVDKTVQPVDLKTSAMSAIDFGQNFIKFRYDIQASMYSDVLRVVMDNAGYMDYSILDYLFVDISRSDKLPLAFRYPQYDESQLAGLSFKGYQYKSWRQLLSEIVDYENEHAIVPKGYTVDGPNDLLTILNNG